MDYNIDYTIEDWRKGQITGGTPVDIVMRDPVPGTDLYVSIESNNKNGTPVLKATLAKKGSGSYLDNYDVVAESELTWLGDHNDPNEGIMHYNGDAFIISLT